MTVALAMLASCAAASPAAPASADRDGIVLRASARAVGDSIVVETVVQNTRAEPIHLVPDQCGRVTEVTLARTVFEPEGEIWEGSLQAAKELILRDQISRQRPDRFQPSVPGDTSSAVPECRQRDRPGPGDEIAERWQLPLGDPVSSLVLAAVGSQGSVIRAELVEARGPDQLEFLDILTPGSPEAEETRQGRLLRVETATAAVIERAPEPPSGAPSLGQLYDRLIDDAALRAWVEAQPADSWRLAQLTPTFPKLGAEDQQQVHLRLVTARYERAAEVTAGPDGDVVALDLPGEADRTRNFPRRPATLPPGVGIIEEPDAPVPSDDVVLGEVILPSGRIAVGEFLSEDEVLDIQVPPGAHLAHATLVRTRDQTGVTGEAVALASLVLSPAKTVRWQQAYVIAVDGGTATITSVEARDLLDDQLTDDEHAWWRLEDEIFASMSAHDYIGTEWPVAEGLNLVRFSSGYGDGGYPVYVGFDENGEPTRVVVDFVLLHLRWPAATD